MSRLCRVLIGPGDERTRTQAGQESQEVRYTWRVLRTHFQRPYMYTFRFYIERDVAETDCPSWGRMGTPTDSAAKGCTGIGRSSHRTSAKIVRASVKVILAHGVLGYCALSSNYIFTPMPTCCPVRRIGTTGPPIPILLRKAGAGIDR